MGRRLFKKIVTSVVALGILITSSPINSIIPMLDIKATREIDNIISITGAIGGSGSGNADTSALYSWNQSYQGIRVSIYNKGGTNVLSNKGGNGAIDIVFAEPPKDFHFGFGGTKFDKPKGGTSPFQLQAALMNSAINGAINRHPTHYDGISKLPDFKGEHYPTNYSGIPTPLLMTGNNYSSNAESIYSFMIEGVPSNVVVNCQGGGNGNDGNLEFILAKQALASGDPGPMRRYVNKISGGSALYNSAIGAVKSGLTDTVRELNEGHLESVIQAEKHVCIGLNKALSIAKSSGNEAVFLLVAYDVRNVAFSLRQYIIDAEKEEARLGKAVALEKLKNNLRAELDSINITLDGSNAIGNIKNGLVGVSYEAALADGETGGTGKSLMDDYNCHGYILPLLDIKRSNEYIFSMSINDSEDPEGVKKAAANMGKTVDQLLPSEIFLLCNYCVVMEPITWFKPLTSKNIGNNEFGLTLNTSKGTYDKCEKFWYGTPTNMARFKKESKNTRYYWESGAHGVLNVMCSGMVIRNRENPGAGFDYFTGHLLGEPETQDKSTFNSLAAGVNGANSHTINVDAVATGTANLGQILDQKGNPHSGYAVSMYIPNSDVLHHTWELGGPTPGNPPIWKGGSDPHGTNYTIVKYYEVKNDKGKVIERHGPYSTGDVPYKIKIHDEPDEPVGIKPEYRVDDWFTHNQVTGSGKNIVGIGPGAGDNEYDKYKNKNISSGNYVQGGTSTGVVTLDNKKNELTLVVKLVKSDTTPPPISPPPAENEITVYQSQITKVIHNSNEKGKLKGKMPWGVVASYGQSNVGGPGWFFPYKVNEMGIQCSRSSDHHETRTGKYSDGTTYTYEHYETCGAKVYYNDDIKVNMNKHQDTTPSAQVVQIATGIDQSAPNGLYNMTPDGVEMFENLLENGTPSSYFQNKFGYAPSPLKFPPVDIPLDSWWKEKSNWEDASKIQMNRYQIGGKKGDEGELDYFTVLGRNFPSNGADIPTLAGYKLGQGEMLDESGILDRFYSGTRELVVKGNNRTKVTENGRMATADGNYAGLLSFGYRAGWSSTVTHCARQTGDFWFYQSSLPHQGTRHISMEPQENFKTNWENPETGEYDTWKFEAGLTVNNFRANGMRQIGDASPEDTADTLNWNNSKENMFNDGGTNGNNLDGRWKESLVTKKWNGPIEFAPYISMTWEDTNGGKSDVLDTAIFEEEPSGGSASEQRRQEIYVLAETKAGDTTKIQYFETVSAKWRPGNGTYPFNLKLGSNQWSIHNRATNNIGWRIPGRVLPGGAIYKLGMDDSKPTEVEITTFSPIIDEYVLNDVLYNKGSLSLSGDGTKTTGGDKPYKSHKDLMDDTATTLDNLRVVQWIRNIDDKENSKSALLNSGYHAWDNEWTEGHGTIKIDPNGNNNMNDIMTKHYSGPAVRNTTNTDSKYNMQISSSRDSNNEGDLDILNDKTDVICLRVFTTTYGDVICEYKTIDSPVTGVWSNKGGNYEQKLITDLVKGMSGSSGDWKKHCGTADTYRRIEGVSGSGSNDGVNYVVLATKGSSLNLRQEIAGFKLDEIDARTNFFSNTLDALVRGQGSDKTAAWGTSWYNEAFDGAMLLVQKTRMEIGFKNPPARGTILDPAFCPPNQGQADLFTSAYMSQFCLNDKADGQGPAVGNRVNGNTPKGYGSGQVGEFASTGNGGKLKVELPGIEGMYQSDKFFIPNVNVQDLK